MKKNKTNQELREQEFQGNIAINDYQEIQEGYSEFASTTEFLNYWANQNNIENNEQYLAIIEKAEYNKRKKDNEILPFVKLSLDIPSLHRLGVCSVHFTILGLKPEMQKDKNGVCITSDLPLLNSIIGRKIVVTPNKAYFNFIRFYQD